MVNYLIITFTYLYLLFLVRFLLWWLSLRSLAVIIAIIWERIIVKLIYRPAIPVMAAPIWLQKPDSGCVLVVDFQGGKETPPVPLSLWSLARWEV